MKANTNRKIVVSALGSRGDVHPVLAVALELRNLGNEVTLLIPTDFREDAEALGFFPYFYEMDINALSKKMKNGVGGIMQVMRWFLESVGMNVEFMLRYGRGADCMVTSSAELHAPIVAEHLGIPHYRIVYAPVLPGDHTPPIVPMRKRSPLINRAVWFGINEGMFLAFGRQINKVRKDLGLPKAKGMLEYLNRNCTTLLAVNRDFAPPNPSWDWDFKYTGYCFHDITGELPDEVFDFIRRGAPPLYIGFGSMNIRKPEAFLDTLRKALDGTGLRIVLSKGWQGLALPEDRRVLQIGDVPHGLLFPHMAGVCHHGGSGTVHMAARAGTPQFIMPYALDQFYWSRRVHELGLGPKPIPPHKLTPDLLKGSLLKLVGRKRYRENAEKFCRKIRGERGIEKTAEAILNDVDLKRGEMNGRKQLCYAN